MLDAYDYAYVFVYDYAYASASGSAHYYACDVNIRYKMHPLWMLLKTPLSVDSPARSTEHSASLALNRLQINGVLRSGLNLKHIAIISTEAIHFGEKTPH